MLPEKQATIETRNFMLNNKKGDYSATPVIRMNGTTYTSAYKMASKTLDIDARSDSIQIHMSEISEAGRETNIIMSIPRDTWNEFKKQLNEHDGSVI